jgi:FAD-dependent urate hydroxylase
MPSILRQKRHALVIGCGIAGPVVAMALRHYGMDTAIYEARDTPGERVGLFLGVAPNGINALKLIGLDGVVTDAGFPMARAVFANRHGHGIGDVDMGGESERFGAATTMIRRAELHRVLRDEVLRRGIPIVVGKRLRRIEHEASGRVRAIFADDSDARGDMMIGCDGIHSDVRDFVARGTVKPTYTGVVGCGGVVPFTPRGVEVGVMHLTFGAQAFFGYFSTPQGETAWFNNLAWPNEPSRDELAAIAPAQWRERLLALHGRDHAPIPELVAAPQSELLQIAIHDMPSLPAWHRGPVCLVGDAAHATSPHGGQGASMAIEDAIVLARCVRDSIDPGQAFATYQALRKPRVERLVQQARRAGQQRVTTNPVALWLRDRLMPLFLRHSGHTMDWVYSYRADRPARLDSAA